VSDNAANFVGSIPEHYDRALGPVIFADFAHEMARQAAASAPQRVLETCAGTGIVTRRLRDRLPADTKLTVTDLNPPMLEVARAKFTAGEAVEFQPADATALPFPDQSFDAVVCQFGVMFFPDKAKSYREAFRVLKPGGALPVQRVGCAPLQPVRAIGTWTGHPAFPRRSATILSSTIRIPPPRPDQGSGDRSRLHRSEDRSAAP
jgi:ubiquinone/menaquinone biosynthesis C-methylase UbiE